MDLSPPEITVIFLSLVFALTIHEAAHAGMAYWCGDDTAKHLGRLSLNPLAHIDLLGTIILPILLLTTTGMMFGWAKPVPFVMRNLNNPQRDPVFIAVAGPASNLALALLTVIVARIIHMTVGLESLGETGTLFIFQFILLNLILIIFNLIPVPPLDGHYVLKFFLPESGQRVLETIGPFGILIAILVAGPVIRTFLPPMLDLVGQLIGL